MNKPPQAKSETKTPAELARAAREAAALRANLLKRKEQGRLRETAKPKQDQ